MIKSEYAGSILWKIEKDSTLWNEIMVFFHKAWNTYRDGTFPPIFPGPQPSSVERRHFKLLKSSEYVVCEKTDGVRHVCLCAKFQNRSYSVLINRALDVHIVSISMPRAAMDGTILDGELVKTKEGRWNFIVYDTVLINGENCSDDNLVDRLEKIKIFTKKIIKMKKDPFVIKPKKMYVLPEFKTFMDDIYPNMPYTTDGLIFTPVNEPVKVGTHDTMFKWKPTDQNTVDFQLKRHSCAWGLYLQERGKIHYASEIPFTKVKKEFVHMLIEDNIVECKYMSSNKSLSWWKPIGVRTDKYHPNNKRTLTRTMVNIEEDIEIVEFYHLFK